MRFLLGLIVGIALTIIAVYFLDRRGEPEEQQMVNWDVVGQKVQGLTGDAQKAWKDFTREITGPE